MHIPFLNVLFTGDVETASTPNIVPEDESLKALQEINSGEMEEVDCMDSVAWNNRGVKIKRPKPRAPRNSLEATIVASTETNAQGSNPRKKRKCNSSTSNSSSRENEGSGDENEPSAKQLCEDRNQKYLDSEADDDEPEEASEIDNDNGDIEFGKYLHQSN